MSESIVLFFLGASLCAYTLTGGADFGVGIVECFARSQDRQRLRKLSEAAITPVWEANHIWIILALVITFVAYPKLQLAMTTTLHLPLLLMLVGIILRGTAFTFRYYDTEDEQGTEKLWSLLFRSGSLLVPFVFGVIAASLQRGTLMSQSAAGTVWELYYAPWLGWLPLCAGIFVVCLFAWIAASFLLGEVLPEERASWHRRQSQWSLALVLSGLAVTIGGWYENAPLLDDARSSPLAIVCVVLATLSLAWLYRPHRYRRVWSDRMFVGLIVVCILTGYFGTAYPVAVRMSGGEVLRFAEAQAPKATLDAMSVVLLAASLLILPGLAWLYKIFKGQASV